MLTTEEAAERLRVSCETVRRWVRLGRLAGVHVGRHWLIPPGEVERVLSVGLTGIAPAPPPPAELPRYQAHDEPAAAERWTPRVIG